VNFQIHLKAIQQLLDEDMTRAKNQARAEKLDTLKNQIAGIKRSLDGIAKEIDARHARLAELGSLMSQYLVFKQEEAGYDELIRDANGQLDQMNNMQLLKDQSSAKWARQPIKPDKPDGASAAAPPATMPA
jgi:hypothetical protein